MGPKVSQEEYIRRAREAHGDLYSYDRAVYAGMSKKLTITCKTHGDFDQIASNHLNKAGCQTCGRLRAKPKIIRKGSKLNADNFLEQAVKAHGKSLDFSKSVFVNRKTKIIVICPSHGEYLANPEDIIKGCGCRLCANAKMSLKNEFVERAEKIHDGRFDYSLVKYVNTSTNVQLKCLSCECVFLQQPASHLSGSGCPGCGERKRRTTATFIEEAISIHGDQFDYSKTVFTLMKNPVIIICRECKTEFQPQADNHLNGHGCPNCANGRLTQEQWVGKCMEKFGDKYDYAESIYVDTHHNVTIKCNTCLKFFTTDANKHLVKSYGCICFRISRGEEEIKTILEKLGIIYDREWIIPGSLLRADFYLPDKNFVIEFDGEQHFQDCAFFMSTKDKVQERDHRKDVKCIEDGISILRIHHKDMDKIEQLLKDFLTLRDQLPSNVCLYRRSRANYT